MDGRGDQQSMTRTRGCRPVATTRAARRAWLSATVSSTGSGSNRRSMALSRDSRAARGLVFPGDKDAEFQLRDAGDADCRLPWDRGDVIGDQDAGVEKCASSRESMQWNVRE
jgi:hypothetical protein